MVKYAEQRKDDEEESHINLFPLYLLLTSGQLLTQCSIVLTAVATILGFAVAHGLLLVPLHK